jgi:hypothetical protein
MKSQHGFYFKINILILFYSHIIVISLYLLFISSKPFTKSYNLLNIIGQNMFFKPIFKLIMKLRLTLDHKQDILIQSQNLKKSNYCIFN